MCRTILWLWRWLADIATILLILLQAHKLLRVVLFFYHKIICGGEVAKNPVETKNVAKKQTISTSLISWKQ